MRHSTMRDEFAIDVRPPKIGGPKTLIASMNGTTIEPTVSILFEALHHLIIRLLPRTPFHNVDHGMVASYLVQLPDVE